MISDSTSSFLFSHHGRAPAGASPECVANPWPDGQESHIRLGNTDKSARRDEVQKLLEVRVNMADR